jgi:mRNA-degrading endonuclease toxin of MazEF toxin-antitoxin module
MARILRGEIRWADLGPVFGHEQTSVRLVLILSHDVFNVRSGTLIVVAMTSQPQKAGFPWNLELTALQKGKLTKNGVVDQSGVKLNIIQVFTYFFYHAH